MSETTFQVYEDVWVSGPRDRVEEWEAYYNDYRKKSLLYDDLLAACEALLTSGQCDLCYEDGCGFGCRCLCHQREVDAKEEARNAIARAEGEAE